jgi:hypothetical protein
VRPALTRLQRLGATPREVGAELDGVRAPLLAGVRPLHGPCMRPLGLLVDELPVAGFERLREVQRLLAPLGRPRDATRA